MTEDQSLAVPEPEAPAAVVEYSSHFPIGGKPVRMISDDQYHFISCRFRAETDEDAIETYNKYCFNKAQHLTIGRVKHWKKNCPEFLAEYNERFPYQVRANAERQITHTLPSAITVLTQGLNAELSNGSPDWRNRMKAVELVARMTGMLKDKMEIKPDLSNLADDEVLRLEMLLERLTVSKQG